MKNLRNLIYKIDDAKSLKMLGEYYGLEGQLTKEQEVELCWLRDNGTETERVFARNRMVMSVKNLLGMFTDKYKPFFLNQTGVYDRDDILQEAFLKSLEIIDKFDPEKGRLSTFMTSCIPHCIVQHNMKNRRGYAVHAGAAYENSRVQNIMNEFAIRNETATPQDIIDATGWSEKKTKKAMIRYPEVMSMNHYGYCAEELSTYIQPREDLMQDGDNLLKNEASAVDVLAEVVKKDVANEIRSHLMSVMTEEDLCFLYLYNVERMTVKEIIEETHCDLSEDKLQRRLKKAKETFYYDPVLRRYAKDLCDIKPFQPGKHVKQRKKAA